MDTDHWLCSKDRASLENYQVFGYLMNRKIIKRDLTISIMDLKKTGEVIEDEIVAIYDLTIQELRSKHEYL